MLISLVSNQRHCFVTSCLFYPELLIQKVRIYAFTNFKNSVWKFAFSGQFGSRFVRYTFRIVKGFQDRWKSSLKMIFWPTREVISQTSNLLLTLSTNFDDGCDGLIYPLSMKRSCERMRSDDSVIKSLTMTIAPSRPSFHLITWNSTTAENSVNRTDCKYRSAKRLSGQLRLINVSLISICYLTLQKSIT